MLGSQIPINSQTDVPAMQDEGAVMAAALHRLAGLRATLYRDWSDGPANLIAFANEDRAAGHGHPLAAAHAWTAPDIILCSDPATGIDTPLDLRGRFDCLDEMPPATERCAEIFALNPNHETAVKIIRTLRVRTDLLQTPAFTDCVNFGRLETRAAFQAWFPSIETPTGAPADALDADTGLSTWGLEDATFCVTAPDRPRPLLSEAELGALLSASTADDSHELDDKWQENPEWRETFWHEVDSYLQSVDDCDSHHTARGVVDELPAAPDIEICDPRVAEAAMYFWRPGDETDLAHDGDGAGLFLVGGDTPGVVLVEDGAMHAMRTGRGTRVGEVVVSWCDDPWTDVDGMGWTRVATLSGISDLRVEQGAAHDRAVVISGELSGTALKADRVRLTELTEDGPVDFPVRQTGGFADALSSDWPFDDMADESAEHRLLV